MDNKTFNKVINEQLEICKNILCQKSKEYDFSEDRLRSFKVASNLTAGTPVSVLLGYLTKHVMSIYDMGLSDNDYPIEKWEEKITDFINYGLLLKALITEENNFKNKPNSIEELFSRVKSVDGDGVTTSYEEY